MAAFKLAGAFLLVFSLTGLAVSNDTRPLDSQVQQILKLDADPDYGEYLASECHTCHSDTQSNGIPLIHPLPADYIIRALLEYKTSVRSNQVMKGVASGLSDDEMAALAAYFTKEQ